MKILREEKNFSLRKCETTGFVYLVLAEEYINCIKHRVLGFCCTDFLPSVCFYAGQKVNMNTPEKALNWLWDRRFEWDPIPEIPKHFPTI